MVIRLLTDDRPSGEHREIPNQRPQTAGERSLTPRK